jgi:transcriptional regulator with XRE-family HTH domain
MAQTGGGMSRFGELLKEARKRARLTQKKLGKKVGVDDSYLSRVERGVYPPPTREVAVKLAGALGIIDKIRRFVFFLAAYVAGDEDMEGLTLVKVADGEAEEEEEQASGTPIYSAARSARGIPDSLLGGTLGDQIKEIKRLVDSVCLTDEEEEMVASLLDTTKQLLSFIENQRKTRKDG